MRKVQPNQVPQPQLNIQNSLSILPQIMPLIYQIHCSWNKMDGKGYASKGTLNTGKNAPDTARVPSSALSSGERKRKTGNKWRSR
jgi:hypothetical protein